MSPELAAILTSALITTIALYITIAKWLPGVLDRREQLYEQRQQSDLKDRDNERQEDIDQRALLKTSTESQIKVSEAQLVLLTQLIETVSRDAATREATTKELNIIAQTNRATERAVTDNTVGINLNTASVNELNQHFGILLNEGSGLLQHVDKNIQDVVLNGVKPDEAARQQLTRIETAVNEINDKVLPCTETKTIMENEMVLVLSEARRLIELFNRDAQLKIEDKRKSDSKPIPPITVDPQEGTEAA